MLRGHRVLQIRWMHIPLSGRARLWADSDGEPPTLSVLVAWTADYRDGRAGRRRAPGLLSPLTGHYHPHTSQRDQGGPDGNR